LLFNGVGLSRRFCKFPPFSFKRLQIDASASPKLWEIELKRALDVVISAFLLLLVSPILFLACMVIRLTSPGPIFFRQMRMGQNFRPFSIFKLRSMSHSQPGMEYTLGTDPRITRFGQWLRHSKIDELPQLWNVLRGDMSLVGPRPVLPQLTAEFCSAYTLLLRSRPGLTDPASLKYCREAALLATAADPMRFFKTVVTPDKICISLEYQERANLWTDCVTLAMTAVVCAVPSLSRLYGEPPSERPAPLPAALWHTPRLRTDTSAAAVAPALERQWGRMAETVHAVGEGGVRAWNHASMPVIDPKSTAKKVAGERSRLQEW
jgi:lipopolysaccharide/colanic/teichoic acid biosynthesis glycosyltransferase